MPEVFRRLPGQFPGLLFLLLLLAAPAVAGAATSAPPLSLSQALERTLRQHPELIAGSEEIGAREAEALQAAAFPNPVLSLEAENLLGSGEFSGTDAAETTLAIEQRLELGGKRRLRRQLADAETSAARADHRAIEADLLARTRDGFFAVLVAQERLQLAEERTSAARRLLAMVEERIAAGRGATTQALRPRIQLREQEIVRGQARDRLAADRRQLAALMGQEAVDFGPAAGDLFHLAPLPELDDLERRLTESPQMARWAAENESRRRATRLEKARRIPDVDLGLGARRLHESDDTALVLGLSVPLPLFDRNQGGIAAARRREAQARAEERGARLQAGAALTAAWREMHAARAEAEALQDDILPAARQALEAASYGYSAGKFDLFEVLEAQRTLIEAQERRLAALGSFHRAMNEINRLLGHPLPSVGQAATFATAKE